MAVRHLEEIPERKNGFFKCLLEGLIHNTENPEPIEGDLAKPLPAIEHHDADVDWVLFEHVKCSIHLVTDFGHTEFVLQPEQHGEDDQADSESTVRNQLVGQKRKRPVDGFALSLPAADEAQDGKIRGNKTAVEVDTTPLINTEIPGAVSTAAEWTTFGKIGLVPFTLCHKSVICSQWNQNVIRNLNGTVSSWSIMLCLPTQHYYPTAVPHQIFNSVFPPIFTEYQSGVLQSGQTFFLLIENR
jgi:hypothetical protein